MSSNSDTEIDVGISVETGELASGMQKATHEVESGAEHMKEALEHVSEGFKEMAELFGIGLSLEWAKEIVEHAAEAAEQVEHLTQSLGMTAQAIQTMSFAAGLIGGNLDTATMAMTRLERAGEQAKAGAAQQAEAFHSIGIESAQLAELLKKPDELIQTVAKDLSGFQDGAAKTAVVMQLFGRNAAQIIPLLNELGHNFDELKDKGKQFSIVLSEADQKSLFETAESINQLKQAAVGLGNEFALALAPAVRSVLDAMTAMATSDFVKGIFTNLKTDIAELVEMFGELKPVIKDVASAISTWYHDFVATFPGMHDAFADATGGMRQDAAQFVADSMSEIDTLKTWFKNGALYIQIAWEQLWADIQNGFNSMLAGINSGLQTVVEWSKGAFNNLNDPFGTMRAGLDQLSTSLKNAGTSFTPVTADVTALREQIEMNNLGLETAKLANDHWAQSVRDSVSAHNAHGEAMDADGKKILDYDAKVKAATDDVIKLSSELAKWSEGNDKLLGSMDPIAKAQMSFNEQMTKATEELVVMLGHGLSWADALNMLSERTDLLTQAEQREIAAFYAKADVLDTLEQKYMDQVAALSQTTNAGKAQVEVDQAIQKELQSLIDQYGAESDAVKTVREMLMANRDAQIANITTLKNHADAVKADQEVMKQWASIASGAFDSAFQAINKDIIEGGSVMKDLVNVAKQVVEAILLQFEKLAIINPILNAIFGQSAGGSLLPTLANSALGSLFGGGSSGSGLLSSLFGNSGSSMLSGLLGSTSGAGSGLIGMLFGGQGSVDMLTYAGLGSDVGAMGTAGLGLDAGVTGGTSGLFGSGGNVAGGLGSIGATLGGAFAGWQLGYQLGGTAGGIAGAAALGYAAYAIPVVGWIAAAATLINSLTGGSLFGTSYKPTGTTFQNLSFGEGGISVQDLVQEHKKGALFSGGSYRDVSVTPTQDQLNSAQAMFDSIKQTIDSAASALGTDVGNLITGTFKEQFDSKGNITSSLSTVLGQTYKETVQQFVERVTADNLLALLPAAQNAQQIAQQWQSSADALMAGTQMLVIAQEDINRGMSLLGSDSSLADIAKVVQDLTQKGETLAQTYVRLQVEQEDLASILSDLGMTTGKTGADFVTFADQLTQAAGSLKNLQSAWNTYYSEYYTQAEQQANTLKHLQDAVTSTFKTIGEDPAESMAKFREDFTAAMPNLTAQEVAEWLAAADALAKLTAANQALAAASNQATSAQKAAQQAAQQKYDDFVTQFSPQALAVTAFEGSLNKLYGAMTANIAQANALAKAAGLAGVSNSDLANIIAASAQQGVDALKQFEAQAAQLAQQLYGTNVQQLQSQLTALQASDKSRLAGMDGYTASALAPYFAKQEQAIQDQIDAANAQAQAIQRLSDATTLLQDFSQIGAVTGMSLSDIAGKDNVPLDQFAKDLGLTVDQLNAQYEQGVLQAQAALKANDYLADILAVLQGKSINALNTTSSIVGSKPTPPVTVVQSPQLSDIHEAIVTLARYVSSGNSGAQSNTQTIVNALTNRNIRQSAVDNSGPRTMQPPRISTPA